MTAALVAAVEELAERIKRLEKAAAAPVRVAWKPREISQMTGIKYQTVLDLIHNGELGHVPAGRLHVVPDEELQRYLSRGINTAGPSKRIA
ncbi:excisionase family DNA-binding protein [Amycolatopsis sp. CA-161197]|uniref:excisionase family DNA-binding protein n=1 Tax=Amycolatopsis sp. CA-161197 TaxID=3239922 RepID=UPI003D927CEC